MGSKNDYPNIGSSACRCGDGCRVDSKNDYSNTGEVLDVIQTNLYTYIEVVKGSGNLWLAASKSNVGVGDIISYPNGAELTKFISKSLNKTFDTISFIDKIQVVTTSTSKKTAAVVSEEAETAPKRTHRSSTPSSSSSNNNSNVFLELAGTAMKGALQRKLDQNKSEYQRALDANKAQQQEQQTEENAREERLRSARAEIERWEDRRSLDRAAIEQPDNFQNNGARGATNNDRYTPKPYSTQSQTTISRAVDCVSDSFRPTSDGSVISITNECDEIITWQLCVNVSGRQFNDTATGVTAPNRTSTYKIWDKNKRVNYRYNWKRGNRVPVQHPSC